MTDNTSVPLENPTSNQLRAGMTLEKVAIAIERSGYPLQTHVAHLLRPFGFHVSPEWSFIDRETSDHRSMDLRATMRLCERGNRTRARPWLDMLIECKQSELPFIFFTGEQMPWQAALPFIAGNKQDEFRIYTDDSQSTWSMSVLDALSLRSHPFFSGAPTAYTLSKCQRKGGSDLILSGDEPYNGIVLPLVKALHHLKKAEAPPKTAVYFDIHYAVSVAVLDAPMLMFENGVAQMTPWARVLRHEAGSIELGKNDRGTTFVIDMVHKDFLQSYVTSHLLPAAHDFASKVLKHDVEVADCEGFVPSLKANRYEVYEPVLEPRPNVPFLGRKPK